MAQVGELYEAGRWYRPGEMLELHRRAIRAAFEMRAHEEGATLGEIEFEDLPPYHQQAPKPPGMGYRYLVGRARVVYVRYSLSLRGAAFLSDLSESSLVALREATRRATGDYTLTDQECDELIAEAGPALAERELVQHVAGRA